MAELVLQNVSRRYPNGVHGVRDLSFRVGDGELFALVGPSGCGKTTTLRLIAGLEAPTSGSIRLGGQVINDLPPRCREVAMVFQRSTLYPHLTVRRNLTFGLEQNGFRRWFRRAESPGSGRSPDLEERIEAVARLLDLEKTLDRLPSQLSGGEQQRVAVGRAVVRRSSLFLLDEPLSHLDSQLRAQIRHELHLLQRQIRATMIYVTHDQAEAMLLADRMAVMDRGALQQEGSPNLVYHQPANRFAAGFVGWPPMNFVDGSLLRKNIGLCFCTDGWEIPVPPSRSLEWASGLGRGLTLGIRPEHVELGPQTGFPMRIDLVEMLGDTSLVTLEHVGRRLIAKVPGKTACRNQDIIKVVFRMEHAHMFDRDTGVVLKGLPAG
jgi:multiple sugar transport system ATP-binding protein